MQIEINDFLENRIKHTGEDYLEVYDESFQVIPPLHLVIQDHTLIKMYDLSEVDLENYSSITELGFLNLFVKSLPNDLYKLDNLNYLEFKYGVDVNIKTEIKKLKKINNLKMIELGSSLISISDFEELKISLPNVEISWGGDNT